MLNPEDALTLLQTRVPEWAANRKEMALIDRWFRDELEDGDMPRLPSRVRGREFKDMRDRSKTPWASRVVTAVAEMLYVDGYFNPEAADTTPTGWEAWQANGFDAHQIAVHRDALALGLAYVVVLPGSDPITGEPMPYLEGVSAMDMVAFYANPARDELPIDALRMEPIYGAKKVRWKLYDVDSIYVFDGDIEGEKVEYIETEEHGLGYCPVIRFASRLDLRGRADGEVEPYIPLFGRIDQDTFDRLVVQRFGSWRVRYATGMVEPETDEEKAAAALHLQVGDFLMNESTDARFGTLDVTPLDGYIRAKESDIEELAAVSQTPSHQLTGKMVNLSAEALAAAEASLNRKVEERKKVFGESWELVLRVAAHVAGDEAGARATAAEVRWRDMESRSLAQVADALGKMAQMLGVPPEALWERIPGVTQQDVDRWKVLAENSDGAFAALLTQAVAPAPQIEADPAAV